MVGFKQEIASFQAVIPKKWQDAAWPEGVLSDAHIKSARPDLTNKDLTAKANGAKIDAAAPTSESKLAEDKSAETAAKPDTQKPTLPEPPATRNPIEIKHTGMAAPKPFTLPLSVIAAGGLTSLQHKKARPEEAPDDSAVIFQLGKGGAVGLNARQQKERLQESIDSGTSGSSNERDIMLDYMIQQQQQAFNQYINTMITYLDDRMEFKRQEITDLEEGMTALNNRHAQTLQRYENLALIQAEDNEQLAVTNATIARLDSEIPQQEIKVQETQRGIESLSEQVAAATSQQNELAQERARTQQAVTAAQNEAEESSIREGASQSDAIQWRRAKEQQERMLAEARSQNEKAEGRSFTDSDGRTVHKDPLGTYYAVDEAGKRTDYSTNQQETLKKKATDEGLLTPEEIRQNQEIVERAERQIERLNKEGAEFLQEADGHRTDKISAQRRQEFYETRRGNLDEDIGEYQTKIDGLLEKRKELGTELEADQKKLDSLKEERLKAGVDQKALEEKIAKQEIELKAAREELAGIEKQQAEQLKKIEVARQDLQRMGEMKQGYEDLRKAKTPEERQAAQQKINGLKGTLSPEEKTRFDEYNQEARKELAEKYKPVPATADNTSRTNGSAAAPIVTASTTLGPPFGAAASGAPATSPAPAAPQDDLFIANKVAKVSGVALPII